MNHGETLIARLRRRWALILVVVAAVLPYLPTLDDYFMQDDFGVVWLLSRKPALTFPKWFVMPWTEDIWGYTPDEIRPFIAVTYQAAAAFGPGSPVPNHALNVAVHATNSALVFSIARHAALVPPGAALLAGLMFAVLPMHPESVAWVTGRVDSGPALFYLAAFLLFVRWRSGGRRSTYWWSVFLCFVALFSKQNTVTLVVALVLYDLVVRRETVRISWASLAPYVPYAALTAGYLALRYVLFHEVAREGMLTGEHFRVFLQDLSVHLKRLVFGPAGLGWPARRVAPALAAATLTVVAAAVLARDRLRAALAPALYFGLIWLALGIAPTVVAGYASPRHMYLAAAGWTIAVAVLFDVVRHVPPARVVRPLVNGLAAVLIGWYVLQLAGEVQAWGRYARISHDAVETIDREILDHPGTTTLVIAGVPRRSWDFALHHALKPPFTRATLTDRGFVISPPELHCCGITDWEQYTRTAIRRWLAAQRNRVVLLYWDDRSGRLTRSTADDESLLRAMMPPLLETGDRALLIRGIDDVIAQIAAARAAERDRR